MSFVKVNLVLKTDQQTDRPIDRQTDRPTDRQTDIATYRAAPLTSLNALIFYCNTSVTIRYFSFIDTVTMSKLFHICYHTVYVTNNPDENSKNDTFKFMHLIIML